VTETLKQADAGAVRTLTLHRPEVRNALDAELLRALVRALRDADADPDVACVVLTGTDPAFTAGLDLKAIAAGELEVAGTGGADANPWRALREIDVPVIGAVNGVAITGGLELALGCDLLVASERARFADTHARVGIHPGGGLTLRLPRAVGIRMAREMSLTGRFVGAAEAHRLRLVNHVVAHEELLPTALQIAAEVAACDRAAVRAIQRAYRDLNELPLGEGLDEEERRMRAWRVDVAGFEERRRQVTERGREQAT
jgi:enoyl-CoA hydratase